MAIRVDRPGVMDALGMGSTSSGARIFEDGAPTPPWTPKPWGSSTELGVSDTLRLMNIPSEAIAAIRPPVPYILFPEQELGFVPEALTIEQVLDTGRWAPQQRSWLSPTIQPPNRRADLQDNVWSGTSRNVSMSPEPMG